MTVKPGQKKLNPPKDEKKKKSFDNFGYWLAWVGFASVILGAVVNLVKKSETPKKNDYYL
jgi:hypothetical protein